MKTTVTPLRGASQPRAQTKKSLTAKESLAQLPDRPGAQPIEARLIRLVNLELTRLEQRASKQAANTLQGKLDGGELETLTKLVSTLRPYLRQDALGLHIEAYLKFLNWLEPKAPTKARSFRQYMDQYIAEMKKREGE